MSDALERYLESCPPHEAPERREWGIMPGPVFQARTGPLLTAIADEVMGNGTGLSLGRRLDQIGRRLDAHLDERGPRGWRRIGELRIADLVKAILVAVAAIAGKGALS